MLYTKNNLINKIEIDYKKLSKGQKMIAQYILNNFEKVPFMTAAKLADSVGVSESTVVRFTNAIGFSGYTEFQGNLQEVIKTKLTTIQRVDMSEGNNNKSASIKSVLLSDIENIKDTIESIDTEAFLNIAKKIIRAKKVYIVGLRSSATISEYLAFYLNFIIDDVILVNYGISDILEKIMRVGKDDVVIGISFPRYSTKTYEVLEYAKKQKANIISITDSMNAPIANLADDTLLAKSNMISFVDSLVAPLSVVNALILSVGMNKSSEIRESFDKLEKIWKEYKIYDEK